jgi:hypothetical protein
MTLPSPVEAKRKYYTVEEANRALPLVKVIVGDIVRQWQTVSDLQSRLLAVRRRDPKRSSGDPYLEEVAHSQAELEAEEEKLEAYREELDKLGVELKGRDGLCDFYSLRDGQEIYLCWRLGEPDVAYWHELDTGFAGRQPVAAPKSPTRVR